MTSKLNELKSDSAKNFEEYREKHNKFKSEIETLGNDTNNKRESFSSLSQELKGMNREDDPLAYDAKEEETTKMQDAYISAQTVEKDKLTEFTQYKEDNPSYSGLLDKKNEIDNLGNELKSLNTEIEKANPETFARDYQEREGRPENYTIYANNTVGEGNREGGGGDGPRNGKLAELAEAAKKDPQIHNTSKTIENTKGDDSLDGGDR